MVMMRVLFNQEEYQFIKKKVRQMPKIPLISTCNPGSLEVERRVLAQIRVMHL